MSVLNKTKTYLVGHLKYLNGRDWRSAVSSKLKPLNITCFDPYNKPFVKDVDESENSRLEMQKLLDLENYDEITNRMKTIRSYDLNLVDRSDFIIAHLVPEVASWGSAEEIVTAVRMKKPIFISMEGGKSKTPLWMFGMFPHKYIYNSINEVLEMIFKIDSGAIEIDSDRWRLLQEKFR